MLTAFGTSTGFLVSYIIYHWYKSGPKSYNGDFSSVYYFVLLSHIILATIIIPLALLSLYRGWASDISKHRKIAVVTLPIWLYVSVTGVIIYIMLYLYCKNQRYLAEHPANIAVVAKIQHIYFVHIC